MANPRFHDLPTADEVSDLDPARASRPPYTTAAGAPELTGTTFRDRELLVRRASADTVQDLLKDPSLVDDLKKEFNAVVEVVDEGKAKAAAWKDAYDGLGTEIKKALDGKNPEVLSLLPVKLRLTPAVTTGIHKPLDTWGVLQRIREAIATANATDVEEAITAKRKADAAAEDAAAEARAAQAVADKHTAVADEAEDAAARFDRLAANTTGEAEKKAATKAAAGYQAIANEYRTLAGEAQKTADAKTRLADEKWGAAREEARTYLDVVEPVSLNHVLFGPSPEGEGRVPKKPFTKPKSLLDGAPFTKPKEFLDGTPYSKPKDLADSYLGMDDAGRTPVSLVIPAPEHNEDGGGPVVLIADSGIGEHPWFDKGVDREPEVISGLRFSQASQVTRDGTGLLEDAAGHGTFIAGLVRQQCPSATLLSVRILGDDNIADEHALATFLTEAVCRQVAGTGKIDILTLSLGYYDEHPDTIVFSTVLQELIDKLGEEGVLVIAAAGNDATAEPLYPAGFAPRRASETRPPAIASGAGLPLVSVGALNPNGTVPGTKPWDESEEQAKRRAFNKGHVALFSNGGATVTCYRPGANLISTMPVTFNGSRQAAIATQVGDATPRSTIDPDDYSGGFAMWSGSSFAVGVLAGEVARKLASRPHVEGAEPPKVDLSLLEEHNIVKPLPKQP